MVTGPCVPQVVHLVLRRERGVTGAAERDDRTVVEHRGGDTRPVVLRLHHDAVRAPLGVAAGEADSGLTFVYRVVAGSETRPRQVSDRAVRLPAEWLRNARVAHRTTAHAIPPATATPAVMRT